MQNTRKLPDPFTENDKLPIRIVSPGFGQLAPEITGQFELTHRKPYYFFLFRLNGCTRHVVEEFNVENNKLLFVTPHRVHQQFVRWAWVLRRVEDIIAIPGTKQVKYLEENIASENVKISAEDLRSMEAAMPVGTVSGNRYPEKFMGASGR